MLIAPAIKATSPDPTGRATPVVQTWSGKKREDKHCARKARACYALGMTMAVTIPSGSGKKREDKHCARKAGACYALGMTNVKGITLLDEAPSFGV